ncbi:hypothetical protein [Brevundimonas sp.]|uniref:hypothetical protein n=1 Tax=Brevundimonas sp. TaxID=1871086 RepID=UPI00199088DD|nr:hypothetical protein [Brevundimonas sp.]MBD3838598.1 hypothetical protein [Brevundimonas sp.]
MFTTLAEVRIGDLARFLSVFATAGAFGADTRPSVASCRDVAPCQHGGKVEQSPATGRFAIP